MTEGEQVKQLTTKILELWWPGEDPTTFDAPEDAELSEVTLVDLKAYATITAGYILQREARAQAIEQAAEAVAQNGTLVTPSDEAGEPYVDVDLEVFNLLRSALEQKETP